MSAQTSVASPVNFDVDDYVRAGDVIVRLEDSQQRAAVTQAEANLKATARRQDAEAGTDQGRVRQGRCREADLDRVTAARKEARAVSRPRRRRSSKRQELDYTAVAAPYNGIVTERLIEVGETAQPGRSLIGPVARQHAHPVDVPQNLVDTIRTEGKAQAQVGGKWIAAQSVTVFRSPIRVRTRSRSA